MKKSISLLAAFAFQASAYGAVIEKTVDYKDGDVSLEGFHAYDDDFEGKRPGILIVHQWTGLTDYEKTRARMLAGLGYNVFAADIYGKGVRPQPPEAGEYAGKYKKDRELYRERMAAGLEILKNDERTDTGRIAAVGYCFGGTGVLEMARAGMDITGIVSFHGGLGAAEGMTAEEGGVKCKVLVCHGAIDPHVPLEEKVAFEKEMEDADVDWQLVSYGGAVHAFTQKMAGDDISKGVAYDAKADERSWVDMQQFFAEIFRES
ncbi:dienelactone hydrolase family protein [Luteolibacter sp. AS25]|uniref:dienelactone hydrolase family protein n=1 Tax=Luteolibacter sp. AS25 TaxID=3135776 RepID=UPI00398ACD8F